MEQIRATQKKYGSIAIFIAIVAALLLFLFGLKSFGKGLILGTLFSIMNFVLMGETLPMKLGVSRSKGTVLSFILIMARYGLLAAPLFAALKFEQFHVATTVLGLFMIQFVILMDAIIRLIYTSILKKNTTENMLWKN